MEHHIERSGRRKKVTFIVEEAPPRGGSSDNGSGLGRLVRLAAAGVAGYALYRSLTQRSGGAGRNAIHVSKNVTIARPVDEIYRFWRNLENLPRAMSHLESVRQLPNGRSRWTAKGPAGSKIEWDAEILVDRENEIISWRSIEGSTVPNEGTVRFRDLGGQRTEVKVSLTYHPPGGSIGAAVAKLFGEEPSQQIDEDLRHLKERFEKGDAVGKTAAMPAQATR